MESGGEYTYAYSLLTLWSRMHSFEGERERATTAAQCNGKRTEREREQRREGARDAEALIRGAGCWECRQAVGANGVNGPCEVKDRPMLRMRDGSRRVGALEGRKK